MAAIKSSMEQLSVLLNASKYGQKMPLLDHDHFCLHQVTCLRNNHFSLCCISKMQRLSRFLFIKPLLSPLASRTICHFAWSIWAGIFRNEWSWWDMLLVKISALRVAPGLIYSWFTGHFSSSGESTKLPCKSRYRVRVGFKLKPMSVRNFCPTRIFSFHIVHFL